MLQPIHVEMTESEELLRLRVEAAGYRAEELEVSVDAHEVTILGKRESPKRGKSDTVVYTERRADQIFRALELPVEIDTSKVTANLRDGVLELAMRKAPSEGPKRKAAQPA